MLKTHTNIALHIIATFTNNEHYIVRQKKNNSELLLSVNYLFVKTALSIRKHARRILQGLMTVLSLSKYYMGNM